MQTRTLVGACTSHEQSVSEHSAGPDEDTEGRGLRRVDRPNHYSQSNIA